MIYARHRRGHWIQRLLDQINALDRKAVVWERLEQVDSIHESTWADAVSSALD